MCKLLAHLSYQKGEFDMNEDRNIYVNYETKDESGKYINPVSMTFNGQVFDLKKYSFKASLI